MVGGLSLDARVIFPVFYMFDDRLFDRFKPGIVHPVTAATFVALTCFCLCGRWPEIQDTRPTAGWWLCATCHIDRTCRSRRYLQT
jgi:hypothetical protein